MTTIKIGGVPEHFNLPWHLAINEGLFSRERVNLQWSDYPAGTGAMCKDLRAGKLDVAVVLTEGIVADIINGCPSKLVHWYVETPLTWGIHTSFNSNVNIQNLKGKKYAISRKGSGSHLMAYVDAQSRQLEINDDQFVLVENITGAREALKTGRADLFFWEKFMTKPLVDTQEFKRIGERPTPWPCFVIAAADSFLENHRVLLQKVIQIVLSRALQFKKDQNTASFIAQKFDLQEEDANEWLRQTTWANNLELDKMTLQKIMDTLFQIKVISKKVNPEDLCAFPLL